MKKHLLVIPVAAIILLLIGSRPAFAGDNSRSFSFKNFSTIEIGSGMRLTVTQSDSYSIEAKGDSDDLEDLEVEKSGDNLKIHFKHNSFFSFRHHHRVEFNIKMPKLTGLDLSGGANGNITMNVSGERFSAELAGGAYLEGNLKCGNIYFDLSGGSKVNIEGSGSNLRIEGSGGSKLKLSSFSGSNVKVELSGGSQAYINMNGVLDADLSGGSHVYYSGKVELGDTDFSGGSGVSKGR